MAALEFLESGDGEPLPVPYQGASKGLNVKLVKTQLDKLTDEISN